MSSQNKIKTVIVLAVTLLVNMMFMFGYTMYLAFTDFADISLTFTTACDMAYIASCSLITLIIVYAHDLSLKEAIKQREEKRRRCDSS